MANERNIQARISNEEWEIIKEQMIAEGWEKPTYLIRARLLGKEHAIPKRIRKNNVEKNQSEIRKNVNTDSIAKERNIQEINNQIVSQSKKRKEILLRKKAEKESKSITKEDTIYKDKRHVIEIKVCTGKEVVIRRKMHKSGYRPLYHDFNIIIWKKEDLKECLGNELYEKLFK